MTLEIICKCLLGEFDNETQISTNWDHIYESIETLAKVMIWRLKNYLQLKVMQLVPFGERFFGQWIEILVKGEYIV
jgi:hypothetical protein